MGPLKYCWTLCGAPNHTADLVPHCVISLLLLNFALCVVQQEKRMSKATEVMMQYVENLKRTYEKDHAELMEFKKLANQNSHRSYGGSAEAGGKRGKWF